MSQLDELQGIIETTNLDEAIIKITQNGYVIRDIRPASLEDVRVEKLRRIRKLITGEKPLIIKRPKYQPPPRSRWRYVWLIPIIGVIVWLILKLG